MVSYWQVIANLPQIIMTQEGNQYSRAYDNEPPSWWSTMKIIPITPMGTTDNFYDAAGDIFDAN